MSFAQHSDNLRSNDWLLNGGLAAATLAVLSAVCLAAFRPIDVKYRDIQTETDELRDLVLHTSDIAGKHQALEARLTKCRQSSSELLQRIPAAPRESDFLAQVCQLAERIGMEVSDYHPGAVEQRENHHEMEVKVIARGEYSALCQFLDQVDRLPRLCRLTRLEVTSPASGTKLSVELIYRIYFAPGASLAPAPAVEAGSAQKG